MISNLSQLPSFFLSFLSNFLLSSIHSLYILCHLAFIFQTHFRHEYRPWTAAKRSRPTKTKQGFIIPEDHFVQESSYKADFKVNVWSVSNAGASSCEKRVVHKKRATHSVFIIPKGMKDAPDSAKEIPCTSAFFHSLIDADKWAFPGLLYDPHPCWARWIYFLKHKWEYV